MKQDFGWGSGLSPFFAPEDFLPTHPSLKEDRRADVLVIGGGISGLLCAYSLLKAGRGVTLVTANTSGGGATRYGTGMLCGDGGTDLEVLARRMGQEAAISWYRLAGNAVEQLEKVLSDTGSKCDFRRRTVFYYASFPKREDELRREYLLRHHIGMDCRWMGKEECEEQFSFPCEGGILMEKGAELNLVKFCRDLADWISLHGGDIFEGSRVNSIEASADGTYRCFCEGGSVSAKAVVDARGGEVLAKRPQLGQRITLFSVVTEPVSTFRGWPEGCLIKSREEFSFLRTTPDGRIVFSGEASSAVTPRGKLGALDADALCRVKYRNLEQDLREMFYGIPRLRREYSFCQGLVIPKKGLPYVGRDPRWKGLCYLYAFGECGLAGALVGAAWVMRMICDEKISCPSYLTLP